MSVDDDPRAEMLRTQAVQACLSAMGAAEVHVYGAAAHEWCGTVLHDSRTLSTYQHMTDADGTWRYQTTIRVEVTRWPVT